MTFDPGEDSGEFSSGGSVVIHLAGAAIGAGGMGPSGYARVSLDEGAAETGLSWLARSGTVGVSILPTQLVTAGANSTNPLMLQELFEITGEEVRPAADGRLHIEQRFHYLGETVVSKTQWRTDGPHPVLEESELSTEAAGGKGWTREIVVAEDWERLPTGEVPRLIRKYAGSFRTDDWEVMEWEATGFSDDVRDEDFRVPIPEGVKVLGLDGVVLSPDRTLSPLDISPEQVSFRATPPESQLDVQERLDAQAGPWVMILVFVSAAAAVAAVVVVWRRRREA